MRQQPYRIILLTGYKQSGKDTTAEYLQGHHHFSRFSYAKMLKDICMIILERSGFDTYPEAYPVLFENPTLKETLITRHGKPVTFRRKFTPEEAQANPMKVVKEGFHKYTMTYRAFLQRVGTEAFRECIDEDIWIRPLVTFIERDIKNTGSKGVILSDTRFTNEYFIMKDMVDAEVPGCSIELYGLIKERSMEDTHISELSIRELLEHPDCTHILNTTTLIDLKEKINTIIKP